MSTPQIENSAAVGQSELSDGLDPVEIGKTYLVNSQRKGTFVARITRVDSTWATGIITAGHAGAMLDYNERGKGEEVTVRRSLCKFTEQGSNAELSGPVTAPLE